MKIGIDCRVLSASICGIARYLINLLNALSEIDNENHYILFSDKDFLYEIKLRDNFHKVILKSKSNFMWEQFMLPEALIRYGVDILHCPQNYGVPFNKKWKVVLTIYDLIPKIFAIYWKNKSKIKRISYNLSLNMSVWRSDKIITVSKNSKSDIINIFRIPEEKIEIIFGGVDPQYKATRSCSTNVIDRYGIEKNYIMHIGGIGFNKNTEIVLSAYKKLKRIDGFSYQLVIVGDKGWFSEEILNESRKIGGVVFTGFLNDEDMQLLYSGASVFLYPSLYEGFGLPVLEAMACGTPVIVSKNSSLPEAAGDACIYVDPYDTNDLAQKILLILKDKNLRDQLIQKGLNRVQEFSWNRTAEQTLRLYESVTD